MRGAARQFARFAVTGGAAFAIGAGLIAALTRAGVDPLVAQAPALAAAVSFTWAINRRWTFAAAKPPSLGEFVRYVAASAAGLAVNAAVYSALILASLAPLAAFAMGTVAAMIFNFAAYRTHVFARR